MHFLYEILGWYLLGGGVKIKAVRFLYEETCYIIVNVSNLYLMLRESYLVQPNAKQKLSAGYVLRVFTPVMV